MNIECDITDDQVWKLYKQFSEEQKENIIKAIIFDDLIIKVWKMIAEHDYDWYWWNTEGWRSGSEIREAIARVQWIKDEYIKDKDALIEALKSKKENYKRYYDKLFELYHKGIIRNEDLPK